MSQKALIEKIKALKTSSDTTYGEGWDSQLSWTKYFLNDREIPNGKLEEWHVAEVLGVNKMNAQVRRLLFEHKPSIFHQIKDMHPELKEAAMGNDGLVEQIEKQKKVVDEALQALMQLETDYEKRPVYYYTTRF